MFKGKLLMINDKSFPINVLLLIINKQTIYVKIGSDFYSLSTVFKLKTTII